jgi:hypothetical protein
MNVLRTAALLAGLVLAAACTDREPAGIDFKADAPPGSISVMTWNVYVGTDVDAIIEALADDDPTNDLPTLLAQLDTLFLTDWSARATAIADEVARRQPVAVGLQEISTFDLSAVGISMPLEFLPILEDALADRGLNYAVAGSVLNIFAEPVPGLSLTDYDVLLVDADRVTVLDVEARTFGLNLVDIIGPIGGIELRRGFVLARVDISGDEYTIVSTHPEPDLGEFDFSELRAAQAMEIVGEIGTATPAIVMGDLNDDPGTPMYQVFAGAGFVDTWAELRPGAVGFTCCHLSSLSNATVSFDERIDYVLVRGIGHPVAGLQGRIDILGNVPADRINGPAYPIWPSDHAGLWGEFLQAPVLGMN